MQIPLSSKVEVFYEERRRLPWQVIIFDSDKERHMTLVAWANDVFANDTNRWLCLKGSLQTIMFFAKKSDLAMLLLRSEVPHKFIGAIESV